MTERAPPSEFAVRVQRGRFNFANPSEESTIVYVAIPGVGASSFNAPDDFPYSTEDRWDEIVHDLLAGERCMWKRPWIATDMATMDAIKKWVDEASDEAMDGLALAWARHALPGARKRLERARAAVRDMLAPLPDEERVEATEAAGVIAEYHRDGPKKCPKCGQPHVVAGTTTIEGVPVWVCDVQACGITVAWRSSDA